jgi:hypothetical protein
VGQRAGPISLIVLAEPLDVLDGTPVSLIELIPPVHQRVYRMGLEHLGVVVGEDIDDFSRVHRAALTGQQFQSPSVEPCYVLFEDFTHVKFYRRSLYDGVILEGARFDGFSHVDDWVPQRLVTATARTRCRGDPGCCRATRPLPGPVFRNDPLRGAPNSMLRMYLDSYVTALVRLCHGSCSAGGRRREPEDAAGDAGSRPGDRG